MTVERHQLLFFFKRIVTGVSKQKYSPMKLVDNQVKMAILVSIGGGKPGAIPFFGTPEVVQHDRITVRVP